MRRGRDSRRPERGFTLVELIVTMILMAIAFMVVVPAIANMLRASSRTSASSSAENTSQVAARLFEADVRTARGDRTTGDRQDLGGLDEITPGTVLDLDDPAAASHDIVHAGPLRLVVNADVNDASAGPEQVEWRLLENDATCGDRNRVDNANWCMVRTVTGAAGAISSEVVTHGRGLFLDTNFCSAAPRKEVFCYTRSVPQGVGVNAWPAARWDWDGGWSPTCVQQVLDTGAGIDVSQRINVSHNAVATGLGIARLDTITKVDAHIPSGAAVGRGSERTFSHAEVAIRSRTSPAYLQAIMCGARAGYGR